MRSKAGTAVVKDSPRSHMTGRRREILDSIASSLAKNGSYSVGMRELAQTAGLNPGTLYHHFRSKDDALLSVCLIAHERVTEDLRSVMRNEVGFHARVASLLEAHCKSLEYLGDYLQVYINLRDQVPTGMRGPLDEGWASYRRSLGRLFNDAKRGGEIPTHLDNRHLGRVLVGFIQIINRLHHAGRHDEIRGFARLTVRVLTRGLGQKRVLQC